MFRVVTYNIKTGLGLDGIRSIRRIGEVLASLSPDIICLQEVDQHIPRSWLSNQPKYLSTRLGMQAVFQRNIKYGIGGYGNCILVKPRVLHCRCHPLPGDGEPRGLLELKALIDGHDITVFCTHLAVEAPVRVEQASKVLEIVKSIHGPKVLCGDMNDIRGSRTISILLDEPALGDAALEIDNPDEPTMGDSRIDYVLPDLHLDVKSYQVIDSNASDHRPVVVDLEIT